MGAIEQFFTLKNRPPQVLGASPSMVASMGAGAEKAKVGAMFTEVHQHYGI